MKQSPEWVARRMRGAHGLGWTPPPVLVGRRDKKTLPLSNTSGYRCVRFRFGTWQAHIGLKQGKQKYLGSYPTAVQAALAYDAAAAELHGERAALNFPVHVSFDARY